MVDSSGLGLRDEPLDSLESWLSFLLRTSTPQVPFKTPQIPPHRDHKALNRGTLGLQVLTLGLEVHKWDLVWAMWGLKALGNVALRSLAAVTSPAIKPYGPRLECPRLRKRVQESPETVRLCFGSKTLFSNHKRNKKFKLFIWTK